FELPISDLPGRALQVSADMHGIVNLWSTDNSGSSTSSGSSTPWPIRFKDLDDHDLQTLSPLLMQLGLELRELSDDERTGAVWRDQYGVRLLRCKQSNQQTCEGERSPQFPAPIDDGQSGPDTERWYLHKRWDGTSGTVNIEERLVAIWDAIK